MEPNHLRSGLVLRPIQHIIQDLSRPVVSSNLHFKRCSTVLLGDDCVSFWKLHSVSYQRKPPVHSIRVHVGQEYKGRSLFQHTHVVEGVKRTKHCCRHCDLATATADYLETKSYESEEGGNMVGLSDW